MKARFIEEFKFRIGLMSKFQQLSKRVNQVGLRDRKALYLANQHSDYFILCSMGGVASSRLYFLFNTFLPQLVNPVVYCSIKKRLIYSKFKHTIRPVDSSNLSKFPALFKEDIIQSKVDVSKIKKAIYIIGDPALTVVSLYNRGIAQNFAIDITQDSKPSIPGTIEEYIAQGEDVLCLQNQVDNWINASVNYDIAIVKYEHMWEHLKEIADFAGLDFRTFKSRFPKKQRRSIKNANYQQLTEHIYGNLQSQIKELPNFQIIKGHA